MSETVSFWPQIPGFSTFGGDTPARATPARESWQAPTLNEGVRARLTDALYDDHYSKMMPREEFDAKMAGKSDKEVADGAYKAFYDGKVDRAKFNESVGFTSAKGSTADAVTAGMSLGFQDELRALAGTGLRTAGTLITGRIPARAEIGAAYDQELRGQRENAQVFRENNPYLGRGLEFAGGMVAGGAGPGVATATPTRAQTVLDAAKIGAVTGFGDAEGDLKDRVEGAGIGLGVGVGAASVAPLLMNAGGMLVGKVARTLGIGDSEVQARNLLLKAFQDDGMQPAQIAAKLDEWKAAGAKPEALFDLGGENVKRLARTAAGRTGPGTEKAVAFLEERQSDQARRVAEDVAKNLGQKASDFHPAMAGLNETRRSSAAPLYERAFSINPTEEQTKAVARFVNDPIGQDALQRGMRVVELEHLVPGVRFNPAIYGVTRGPDGRWVVEPGKLPNVRLLDAVKRGYDEIVEGFRNPVTGHLQLDQYGRAVNDVRATYTGKLRELFPQYGEALNAWAGPSQLMDAANRGRNIFTMRDSEMAAAAAAARNNPAEADAFRLGAAQAIRDQIARAPDGADAVKRIFGSPQKRELLRAAFPDAEAFKAFEAAMKREASMFKNAQFVSPRTGSQTAMRQGDAQDLGGMAADVAGAALLGGILPGRSAAGAAGQALTNLGARSQGITPGVADSLARSLFTSDPVAMKGTAGLLGQTDLANELARIQSRRIGGLLLPGITAGGMVAP